MPGRGWSGVARYGLPGLFLGLALASGGRGGRELWAQGPHPAAAPRPAVPGPSFDPPQAGAPGGEAGDTIAFTTNTGGPAQLLYLIDTRSRAFMIYRVDSTKGTVKLDAARQYNWDLKLSSYNNVGLEAAAVESMVKTLGQPKSR